MEKNTYSRIIINEVQKRLEDLKVKVDPKEVIRYYELLQNLSKFTERKNGRQAHLIEIKKEYPAKYEELLEKSKEQDKKDDKNAQQVCKMIADIKSVNDDLIKEVNIPEIEKNVKEILVYKLQSNGMRKKPTLQVIDLLNKQNNRPL